MSKETYGIILAVGSFVVFLALYLIDKSQRQIPFYIPIVLLIVLVALSLFTTIMLVPWFLSPVHLAEKIWRVFLATCVVLLLVGRFGIWLGFLTTQPEIRMSFVNPKYPEWRISNQSSDVVEHVKYWFGLVDLDQPYLNSAPNLDETVTPYAPLRIPVQEISYINAGDTAGALVLPDDLIQKIKHGDRIFGVAQLECPKCNDRGYWLYLKYGYSGWFSEMVGHSTKGLTMPIPIENTDEQLENLVPSRLRKPIE